MTVKRATFHQRLPEDQRLDWCQWLKYHTIDPHTVMMYSTSGRLCFVEIDTALYRVRYVFADKLGWLHDVSVQLEAAPSDFPKSAVESFYTDVKVIV